jgi:hypothetical protein
MLNIKLYLLLLLPFLLISCGINDPYHDHYVDTQPPAPPTGIVVYNGDNRADIAWNPNRESDLEGYNIYYSDSYDGKYTYIGSSTDEYFVDRDAVNGSKYYYAVTAYDYNGNESELSYDVVYSAPRPEGYQVAVFDYNYNADNSGFTFNDYNVVPYDDQSTDFYVQYANGKYYLDVYDDTEIQDMGATQNIYGIPWAPESGWSPSGSEQVVIGHTYVIWTWDNHYAKVRVSNISGHRIVFDWAFQLIKGEPLLKTGTAKLARGPLTRERK